MNHHLLMHIIAKQIDNLNFKVRTNDTKTNTSNKNHRQSTHAKM